MRLRKAEQKSKTAKEIWKLEQAWARTTKRRKLAADNKRKRGREGKESESSLRWAPSLPPESAVTAT